MTKESNENFTTGRGTGMTCFNIYELLKRNNSVIVVDSKNDLDVMNKFQCLIGSNNLLIK